MERELKGGRIRALVATSALELGIDVGSIECVIQVQSPKGIARGLQRVGRSGHVVSARSTGRIFPTHREDLVESAVIAKGMLEHDVELTSIPRNCLDVLAQQIVAMVSVEEWDVDDLFDLIRSSFCYADLSRDLYHSVLRMLAGRYSDDALRDFRPRLSWDRVNNRLLPLPGSGRLAILGGGTIPDRGYYGVYLQDGKTKVGEVDEEFVFESRVGDTFILGSSVWRVAEIDPNRVMVTPAPGAPARMPFWRGEAVGRSYELGCRVGEFRRRMGELVETPECLAWLRSEFPVDRRAAWNIAEYFRRQRNVAGTIPHDRLLLVERFDDELGDPRIAVHTGFGRRVNGLLALVLERRMRERTGAEGQALSNDDGILLRPGVEGEILSDLFDAFTAEGAREIVLEEILESPLFAGQFRQNAQRALLMPKGYGGKRTPLWLQRLRAADLLTVARRSADFPIVIETMREVLYDLLDLPHFLELARRIETGEIAVQTSRTEVPSPFTASLLFDFVSVYMYEPAQTHADRQNRFVSVNRELLAEILDREDVCGLLRPEAISAVEARLQHEAEGTHARSPEELMEILLRLGDLSEEEVARRCEEKGYLGVLSTDGRARKILIGGQGRWIAGEDAELYAAIDTEAGASALVRRHLRSRGPVSVTDLASRYGFTLERASRLLHSLPAGEGMLRGTFRGSASGEEWCYRPNLERIHRATVQILRKEITPCSIPELTRFLSRWTGLLPGGGASGSPDLRTILSRLQGFSVPAEVLERDILSPRLRGGHPREELNHLGSRGEFLWFGAGPGRFVVTSREELASFLPASPPDEALSEQARRIRNALRRYGAVFLSDLRRATGLSLAALNAGLSELFWKGAVTNDLFAELLSLKRPARIPGDASLEPGQILVPWHNQARPRIMRDARKALRELPGWNGRWALLHQPDPESAAEEELRIGRWTEQLLARYGVVTREIVTREDAPSWSLVAAQLNQMELRGEVRRGYFVEGLSGAQYARPEAMEELRRVRSTPPEGVILLNSCDPANPYGPGIPLPEESGGGAVLRQGGNFIAFEGGGPILLLENGGSSIRTLGRPDTAAVTEALRRFIQLTRFSPAVKPMKRIVVESWDGSRPAATSWGGVLRSLGFRGDARQTMRYEEY
jgi:ATP-dependent Lhr-like helicase